MGGRPCGGAAAVAADEARKVKERVAARALGLLVRARRRWRRRLYRPLSPRSPHRRSLAPLL